MGIKNSQRLDGFFGNMVYHCYSKDMNSQPPLPFPEIIQQLGKISTAITRHEYEGASSLEGLLRMVVESVTGLFPQSAALIYTIDNITCTFDPRSRFASGEIPNSTIDLPRSTGLGATALETRQTIVSVDYPQIGIHPAITALGYQSAVCFPLWVPEETLGVFYIFFKQPEHPHPTSLSVLESFANLVALTLSASHRYQLAEQEKSRKERELRRLRRAGMLLTSRMSLKETLEVILHMAMEVTDAQYGIFRLVDKSGNNLITQAFFGENLKQPATESLPINESTITGLVAIRREPVMIPDLTMEPWNSIYYPLDHGMVMRSELLVPLIGASGRLEGILNLESPQINGFDKQDRYILQIFATLAVTVIQEMRLLDMLQDFTQALLSQPLAVTHQRLIDQACNLLNAPFSVLWLREGDQLVIKAASLPELSGYRLSLVHSHIGRAISIGETVASLPADAELPSESLHLPEFGRAIIAPLYEHGVPQQSPQIPAGAFCVYLDRQDTRELNQTEWDTKILSLIGQYAILAIQDAARQDAMRTAQEQHTVTEAFAAIGDIASNLLHQLNNKIGAIPVRVEGIQDKCQAVLAEDAYLSHNIDLIGKSATEAIEVVRDSMFHLRPIQFSAVSVAASVQEALNILQISANIQINLVGLDDLPQVHACPIRLPLVFQNLLDNAIRAFQGEGMITVKGSRVGQLVRIQVNDNGSGIPPELHDRIFEFNYSTRAVGNQGHLGFGLWWVKTLMTRFGGSIIVESDGHSGTSFILELPIEESPS